MSEKNIGKKALVTGACGYSASYLINELLKQGWEVKATDLERASRKRLEQFGDNIKFIPADITDKSSLKEVVKDVDIVFHTAAIFDYSTPIEILRKVNVQGTRNVIEESIEAGVQKVVSWSSVAVYGSADPKHYKIPITEDQKLNPRVKGRYDQSKREQEQAAMEYYKEQGFPITFLRCGAIYGPGSYYGVYGMFWYIKSGIITAFPRNAHNSSFPLVHAEDIARAAIYFSDPKKYNGEAYNIVDDNELDLLQTLKFIASNIGTGRKFGVMIPIPFKLVRPLLNLFASISLFNARHFRKKIDGRPPTPRLEKDVIEYIYGNYHFSNKKSKEAGFEYKYAERKIGIIKTLKWYDENGWEEIHH
ncbi:MAG: NAD-dependent epimerase/dehydratase family protein [Promethearchaeia archaeon]